MTSSRVVTAVFVALFLVIGVVLWQLQRLVAAVPCPTLYLGQVVQTDKGGVLLLVPHPVCHAPIDHGDPKQST